MGLYDVAKEVEADMTKILKGELYVTLPEPVTAERVIIEQDKKRGQMQ
jgi:hypothetical protein